MKIGVYGGTFNPPHLGHVTAARAVFELLKLDLLLLVPDREPPHKALPAGSPTPEQRLEMTRLAGEQLGLGDRVQVLDLELKRTGRSYTSDTLAQLKESVGHIDMMVTGASAITPSGIRFGKGHGYFDLEWAMLSSKGIADNSTVIIGAGHDCQVADVPVTVEEYDTAIDFIVTPTRIIETRHEFPRPSKGIIWSRLAPGMREQIPPVQELWCEVHCK